VHEDDPFVQQQFDFVFDECADKKLRASRMWSFLGTTQVVPCYKALATQLFNGFTR